MKLVIATKNAGKLSEVAAYLDGAGAGVELLSLADFPGFPDIEENGGTFLENALIKARTVSSVTGLLALADDSGLVVDALDGAPGVRSARFAPTDAERNAKLLVMLDTVPDYARTARFVCAMAFVGPDGSEWTTEGVCEGIIARKPIGEDGFGYDPIFYYPPLDATFAQLPRDMKNSVSHRGIALRAFAGAAASLGLTG